MHPVDYLYWGEKGGDTRMAIEKESYAERMEKSEQERAELRKREKKHKEQTGKHKPLKPSSGGLLDQWE